MKAVIVVSATHRHPDMANARWELLLAVTTDLFRRCRAKHSKRPALETVVQAACDNRRPDHVVRSKAADRAMQNDLRSLLGKTLVSVTNAPNVFTSHTLE